MKKARLPPAASLEADDSINGWIYTELHQVERINFQ